MIGCPIKISRKRAKYCSLLVLINEGREISDSNHNVNNLAQDADDLTGGNVTDDFEYVDHNVGYYLGITLGVVLPLVIICLFGLEGIAQCFNFVCLKLCPTTWIESHRNRTCFHKDIKQQIILKEKTQDKKKMKFNMPNVTLPSFGGFRRNKNKTKKFNVNQRNNYTGKKEQDEVLSDEEDDDEKDDDNDDSTTTSSDTDIGKIKKKVNRGENVGPKSKKVIVKNLKIKSNDLNNEEIRKFNESEKKELTKEDSTIISKIDTEPPHNAPPVNESEKSTIISKIEIKDTETPQNTPPVDKKIIDNESSNINFEVRTSNTSPTVEVAVNQNTPG